MKKQLSGFHRAVAYVLALLTLAGLVSLCSCGDQANVNTEAPETTASIPVEGEVTSAGEEETQSLFKKADYNGQKLVVWQRDYNANDYASEFIANFSSDTSDLMSQAVMKRNNMVEDYYNVVLDVRNGFTSDSYSVQVQAGDCEAELLHAMRSVLVPKIVSGQLMSFDELDVDYSTAWWHQRGFKDFEVAGEHYLASNDVSVYRFCGARFFYWNKRIQKDYNLANPYDLIKEDKWDVEHFLQMVQGVSTDNGFTSLGEYGLLLETGAGNGVFAHMASGCGITLTEVDSNHDIQVVLADQTEKIDALFSKLKATFGNMNCVLDFSIAQALDIYQEGAGTAHVFDWGRKLFANGHFLFTQTDITCSVQFIEMKDEYGVAPNPKYNSDQKEYIHKDDSNSLSFAIPNTINVNTERLGTVLDYWAYVSTDTVIADYYEITIKTKRAYEPEAGQVIDIVKDTTMTEIAECMGIGIAGILNDAYGGGSIYSIWASKKNAIQESLKAYNEYEP